MTVAAKLRKGSKIEVHGVVVRVSKREKWSPVLVKIHFEDCGNELPTYAPKADALTEKLYKLTDQIEVL